MKKQKTSARRKSKLSPKNELKKEAKKVNRKKVLITVVCIFVAVVLLFGATLGLILAVKNAKAVVRFKNVRIYEGEANYLLSVYKRDFLIRHHSYGDESFWEEKYDEKHTYRDLLAEESEKYLRDIAIRNYMFETVDGIKFTGLDELSVKKAINEVLEYRESEGSVEKFNELAAPYGFDFDDFSSAAYLLYKAEAVQSRIYGADGSLIKNSPLDCEKYFGNNYSHVKLLFIRTEDKFELDDKGNRVQDENGLDKRIELTPEQKAERLATIADIEAKIEARKNNSGTQMSVTHFDYLISTVGERDKERADMSYYFSAYSEFSNEFYIDPNGKVNESRLELVKECLSMDKDSYSRKDLDEGVVCFIYKYENGANAYTNTDDLCFSDFYALCATKTFGDTVLGFYDDVIFKEKFYMTDFVSLPGENPFVPKFEMA